MLTHITAPLDQPGIRERISHEIQQEFDGTVIWGEDLMQIIVPVAGIVDIEGH